MDPSISWPCSLGFCLDRTGRRKYVLECLITLSTSKFHKRLGVYCLNQQWTTQQSFPRIVVVILIIGVQEHRPLITSYGELSCGELLFNSTKEVNYSWTRRSNTLTYSSSDQSTPVGQRSPPVISWWKPRPCFTFLAMGGMRGSPGGVSQSIIADFRLFVSSDLALEAPFCNLGGDG